MRAAPGPQVAVAAAGGGADMGVGASEAARRAAILDAAGCVFTEKGFEAATTLDIARLARVSKRDLYRLFDSKQGLLEALVATHTAAMEFDPRLGDPVDRARFLEILREFGRRFLSEYLDPRRVGLYRLAIAEAPRSTRLSEALQAQGAERVKRSAIAFIGAAVARGVVAPQDAEPVMTAFFDVLVGSFHLGMLLGLHGTPTAAEIAVQADRAVEMVARMTAGRA